VTEAQDVHGTCFGEDRLDASLRTCLGYSAHDIQASVIEAVCDFVGDAPQFDDLTLVTVVRET
jgi:sigma-B regulation protein RsbU (phosphoserine phosphatase)